MAEGGVGDMWTRDILRLYRDAGFQLAVHKCFLFRLDNMYVFAA